MSKQMFGGDELAISAWKGKYALPEETHHDQMHRRMAKEFARMEQRFIKEEGDTVDKDLSPYGKNRDDLTEGQIFHLFRDFKYIVPQGSVMSQLGAGSIGALSNCFVIGQPTDSYGGIMLKDEEMVQLMKRRGGVGLDISTLRPEGTPTSNAAKSSTGAISFMHRFSNTTREVAQNGRRGALMLSIDVNHPDVMEFAKIKRDLSKVTGANISIRLNDEFMKAVEDKRDYYLRFPVEMTLEDIDEADLPYNELVKFWDGTSVKRIRAKELWDEIIKSAHGVAEPGMFFINNHWDYSPDGVYAQYRGVTTNPLT